jgi:N-acetylglucosaminyl-diphospho-decaprenol L-rhamnosyltransferase
MIRTASTTAIIVTYNSKEYIHDALSALREPNNSGDLECVVVDNASSDETAAFVAKMHPWVNLVENKRNIGFGRGCNLGFKQVQTPYVLIHNPDAVLEFKALKKLVEFMDFHPEVGIVAPAIIEGKERLQAAGLVTTPTTLLKSVVGSRLAKSKQRTIIPGGAPFQTSWVCGAMMLIRADLYRCLEGFDPRFFLYFEETDFCRRALRQGSRIWAVGEAVAHHYGGASAKSTGKVMTSSCLSDHFYRSRYYYILKHFGCLTAVSLEILLWVLNFMRYIKNSMIQQKPIDIKTINYPLLRLPAKPR